MDGTARARRHDRDAVPDAVVDVFPLGISAATIGIAEGALAAHLDYQRERVGASGTAIRDDPYVMYPVGEAAADINAARQELLANADRIYDIVDAGKDVSFEDRAAGRRAPGPCGVARGVGGRRDIHPLRRQRARMDKPMQRYWRDVHVGQAHAIHVPGPAYHASALSSLGIETAGPAAGDDLTQHHGARRSRGAQHVPV